MVLYDWNSSFWLNQGWGFDTVADRISLCMSAFSLHGCTVCPCISWCVCVSVNDPVKQQAALAVKGQLMVRANRRGGGGSKWVQIELRLSSGGRYSCEVGGLTVIHHAVIRQKGVSWVALSIPTWEAWKWRGRAVIIYSPQLLTLDSELIMEERKSDRTWHVPEPVTLISVRCQRQEVREEEHASLGFHCGFVRACLYMFVCISARWGHVGGPHPRDWAMTQDDTW